MTPAEVSPPLKFSFFNRTENTFFSVPAIQQSHMLLKLINISFLFLYFSALLFCYFVRYWYSTCGFLTCFSCFSVNSLCLYAYAVSPTVKGRTNLKIKEKYLSPAGSTSKGLTVSRSNSSLSLYSSASAPTSPMTRKARQTLQRPEFSSCTSIDIILILKCKLFLTGLLWNIKYSMRKLT